MKLSDSQNYINSRQLVHKLLRFVDFESSNIILEIGPGKGIITDALVRQKKKVIAIEDDQKLFSRLQEKYACVTNLSLIKSDFLKYSTPDEPFIIVSNIPFNITADIVRKITDEQSRLHAAYLIMQEEAATKFLGAPYAHSPLLSHFLNINFEIKKLMEIDKLNYSPSPKYNTAFISIQRRQSPIFNKYTADQFKDFLVYLFKRRKPHIEEALKSLMSNLQIKIILSELHITKDVNIKKIVFTDWVNIFRTFVSHAPEKSKKKIQGCYEELLLEQSQLKKLNRTRKDD